MASIPTRTGKSEELLKATFQMMQNIPEASLEINANHSEFNVLEDIADRVKVNGVSGIRTISFPSGPIVSERMVETLPDEIKCLDCDAPPVFCRYCKPCALKREKELEDSLKSSTQQISLTIRFPFLYRVLTPRESLARCVWYGWGLNQEPRCQVCMAVCDWEHIAAFNATPCNSKGHKRPVVLCPRCRRGKYFPCIDCEMQRRRPIDEDELDLIWIDESEFVPPDTWLKMIIPLDK